MDFDFLAAPAELWQCFAPTKVTKLNSQAGNFFIKNGAEFNYSKAELNRCSFYYFGLTGYCADYSTYFFIAEVTSSDGNDRIDNHLIMEFTQNSYDIDKILLDFFEIFPAPRVSTPIKNPNGTIEQILMDCGQWFADFEELYMIQCAAMAAKKRKKVVDKNKRLD